MWEHESDSRARTFSDLQELILTFINGGASD